jgi:hypothetical protein
MDKFVLVSGRNLEERTLVQIFFQKGKGMPQHCLPDFPEIVIGDGLMVNGVFVHPKL